MHPVMRLKPDEVDTPEQRGQITVTFVGCTQKTVLLAIAFAEAGFKVACTDPNQSIIKRLSKGHVQLGERQNEAKLKGFIRKERIIVTGDLKGTVASSDVTIITINVKIDEKKISNNAEVVGICRQVGANLHKDCLVIYGGVAGLGFVEGLFKETLENTSGLKTGDSLGVAYTPILSSKLENFNQMFDQEISIAADDKHSLSVASLIFEVATKKSINKISSTKIAEAAALFAAAKLDVNTALNNELAIFCEKAGLDYFDTAKLMKKVGTEVSDRPTINEEVNRNETYLLLETAENLNSNLRLSTLSRQVNEQMIKHAITLIQVALRTAGKNLRRAKVALLGSAEDETTTSMFVELLRGKGVKVRCYDPNLSENEGQEGIAAIKKTFNEAVEGTDCLVVLPGQEQLRRLNLKKLRAQMKSPAALVDLDGRLEPKKVENAGFVYRGLGKGASNE